MEGSCQRQAPAALPHPKTRVRSVGGRMGPRVFVEFLEERNPLFLPGFEPQTFRLRSAVYWCSVWPMTHNTSYSKMYLHSNNRYCILQYSTVVNSYEECDAWGLDAVAFDSGLWCTGLTAPPQCVIQPLPALLNTTRYRTRAKFKYAELYFSHFLFFVSWLWYLVCHSEVKHRLMGFENWLRGVA